MNDLVYRYRKVDEDFFEELEEILIGADVGVATVMELIDQLKEEVQRRNIQDPKEVQAVISEKLVGIYKGDSDFSNEINMQEDQLTVVLFVGVNGVGKRRQLVNWRISLNQKASQSYWRQETHSVLERLNN